MGFLNAITDNPYLTVGLFGLVMLLSELAYAKQCWHYNFEQTDAMQAHLLNKRYKLNQRQDVDLPDINRRISRCHIIVILCSCGVMLLNLFVGALVFLVGNFLSSYLLICKIGKSYTEKDGPGG